MDTIAVIDDRADVRRTLARRIVRELRKLSVAWRVLDSSPLASLDAYPAWLKENYVRVLVLDEKLSEQFEGDLAVDYSGHQVAELIRKKFPELPQVIVTAVPGSDDLESAGDLDAVVARSEFDRHPATHVGRMVRMGLRYVDRNQEELAELTMLSEKAAASELTHEERERLDALRAKIQAQSEDPGPEIRQWVVEARDVVERLKKVLDDLGADGSPGEGKP